MITLLTTIEPLLFDAVASHPLQSYAWGLARMDEGKHVVRFGIYDGDLLVDVYQMTLHPIPYTRKYIAYCPRSRMPSDVILAFLRSWALENRIVCIKFEPDVVKDAHVVYPQNSFFIKSLSPLLTHWTQQISLAGKTEAQLLTLCDSRTRYNIRLAEKKGVGVETLCDEKHFDDFFSLYQATEQRQGYAGHNREHHHAIWQRMSDAGYERLCVAYKDDVPLAGCTGFFFNGIAYYPYGGSSDVPLLIYGEVYLRHIQRSIRGEGLLILKKDMVLNLLNT